MNILVVQGGARKKGNTALVLSLVEQELQKGGHGVTRIYLHGKNMHGCMGCKACKKKPDEIGCVQNDDVLPILQEMLVSDVVIFSSPLYFWGVNAQLKTVIDRMYSLYTGAYTQKHNSLLARKKLALAMTGGAEWLDNAECAFTAFRRMMPYFKTVYGGGLYIGKCTTPEKMAPSVPQQVAQFVQTLVE